MTELNAFLPLVRGRLPGCPEMILENAVRYACIEFCRRTRLLTQVANVTTTADEPTCPLEFDAGVVWEVLAVRRSEQALMASDRATFQAQAWDVTTGTPVAYYLAGEGTLVLGPIPDASETLQTTVAMAPEATASAVDDSLWYDHYATIAAGARAWVRRNYGDWANVDLEAEDRRIFEHAIHNQNIRRARGGGTASLRVRSHPF